MKKTVLLLIVMISSLSSNLVNAQWVWVNAASYNVWSNTYKTEYIRIEVFNGETIQNPSGCTDPDSYYIPASLSGGVQSRIYSALLLALSQSKKLKLWVEGCEVNRPAVWNVVSFPY